MFLSAPVDCELFEDRFCLTPFLTSSSWHHSWHESLLAACFQPKSPPQAKVSSALMIGQNAAIQ